MGHTQTHEAMVLRTFDVGEADRFCIVLTRQRGRIAARARGVRKLQSKMGGSLLPFRIVALDIREGSTGFLITGCSSSAPLADLPLSGFLQMQQVAELLIAMLDDDHPVPEVFDITRQMRSAVCEAETQPRMLPFTVRLLTHLGVLPQDERHQLFQHLTEEERAFLGACTAEGWMQAQLPTGNGSRNLWMLLQRILEQQTDRSLRTMRTAFDGVA